MKFFIDIKYSYNSFHANDQINNFLSNEPVLLLISNCSFRYWAITFLYFSWVFATVTKQFISLGCPQSGRSLCLTTVTFCLLGWKAKHNLLSFYIFFISNTWNVITIFHLDIVTGPYCYVLEIPRTETLLFTDML